MIIVIRNDATPRQLDRIRNEVERQGARTELAEGPTRKIVTCLRPGPMRVDVVGECVSEETRDPLGRLDPEELRSLDGVEAVHPGACPWPRAARRGREIPSVVRAGDLPHQTVGGRALALIAGPCSVEGREMLLATARAVRGAGAGLLRGGAFKPRTSPYAFQGLGEAALEMLAEARAVTGLSIVTEVLDPRQAEQVAAHADVLQVGARNMQNYPLLREVGMLHRPVLLKRAPSGTIKEFLLAAEHVMAAGTRDVILCERGIRTFDTATRNTLDVAAVPVLKRETHLPVIVDPSHAGGDRELVAPLAFAAVAAGADGLMVEVHPEPARALSDGDQSLTLDAFAELVRRLVPFAEAAGRTLAEPARAEPEARARALRGAA
jgi:3-deoxy-7-phosphoheptulonate synthase